MPLRKPIREKSERLNLEIVAKAIETVKAALPLFVTGSPIFRKGAGGELRVDVPILYMNFGVDRIHYDPCSKMPSPKGRPVAVRGVDVDPDEVREAVERTLREARVVEAVEFREHERA